MKTRIAILVFCGLFISGCSANSQNRLDREGALSRVKHNIKSARRYFRTDGMVSRTLDVTFIDSNTIEFRLEVQNKKEGTSSRIQGLALKPVEADPEIDQDELGNAYPADQYIFNDGCWISFRIDAVSKEKIRILEAGCTSRRDEGCSFASSGPLLEIEVSESE